MEVEIRLRIGFEECFTNEVSGLQIIICQKFTQIISHRSRICLLKTVLIMKFRMMFGMVLGMMF